MGLPSLSIVIPQFIVLVLSLSFHEAAHAWTANRLGDPTARLLGRLTLNPLAHIDWIGTVAFPLIAMLSGVPLIGWAKPVPVNMHNLRDPRRDFAIVALAGPVSNLILSAGAAILLRVLSPFIPESAGWSSEAINFLFQIVRLNTLLAIFNMIPVPPLDGGNVLMGLVPERVALGISWLRPYGFLIIYALMFTGTLSLYIFPLANRIVGWLL
jgi:Zn-dependent protease